MTHRWGPHFPDAKRPSYTTPAAHAALSLAPTVTNSGNFDLTSLVALVGGAAGNLITVQFEVASLPLGVVVTLSETATTALIKFKSTTTLAQLAAALLSSTLIKLVGTYDPLALMAPGDDEFGPLALTGGADARLTNVTFWGPHFPDTDPLVLMISGIGPAGSATFALALEDGFQVTYSWGCGVIKTYSGLESRLATLDDPKQVYTGPALVLGANNAAARLQLQQFAALGQAFLLGLPYEALTLTGAPSGTTLPVTSTALSDWALPGQRVVVTAVVGDQIVAVNAVIQSVTSTTIVVDTAPGSVIGTASAQVMPAVAVYLDAQQAFDRYPPAGAIETWTIKATAAFFGYFSAPVTALLSLASPITTSGTLTGVTLTAIAQGSAGNAVSVQFEAASLGLGINVSYTESGTSALVRFRAGTCTMTQLVAAILAGSTLIAVNGTYTGTATLQATTDEFGPIDLAGGFDQEPGTMGLGATVKQYFGRPLWDRGIESTGTVGDTMHSMVEVVDDVGALPFSVGMATTPDYGRALSLTRNLGPDFQWLKAFLFALRGAQVAFWLATYRADMAGIGNGPGGGTTGTILVSSANGDVFTWWPLVRQHVLITQGVHDYHCQVTAAVDNGNGTITLTLATDPADVSAVLPAATTMDCISWLELCRMETDDAPVAFRGGLFSMQTTARVVTQ